MQTMLPMEMIQGFTLPVGGFGLNSFHDLAEVPFFGFSWQDGFTR